MPIEERDAKRLEMFEHPFHNEGRHGRHLRDRMFQILGQREAREIVEAPSNRNARMDADRNAKPFNFRVNRPERLVSQTFAITTVPWRRHHADRRRVEFLDGTAGFLHGLRRFLQRG